MLVFILSIRVFPSRSPGTRRAVLGSLGVSQRSLSRSLATLRPGVSLPRVAPRSASNGQQTLPSAPARSKRASVGASTPETRHHNNPIWSPGAQRPHPLPLGLRFSRSERYDRSCTTRIRALDAVFVVALTELWSFFFLDDQFENFGFEFNSSLVAPSICSALTSLHQMLHSLILRHLSGPISIHKSRGIRQITHYV